MSDDLNQSFVLAAKAGDLVQLKDLWLEGAEIDARPGDGNSALFNAAYDGRLDCLLFLIEKGAYLDIRNGVDCTALMGAANNGHIACVKALLDAGADPAIRSKKRDDRSAEDWAREKKFPGIELLLKDAVKLDIPRRQPPPRMIPPEVSEDQAIFYSKLVDRTLQEIFNFRSRERISLLRVSRKGPVEAMTRESFSLIDDQDVIQKAFDIYKQAGGKISEAEVFPERIVKVAAPSLGKGKM